MAGNTAQTELQVLITAINNATGALNGVKGDFKKTFDSISSDSKLLRAFLEGMLSGFADEAKKAFKDAGESAKSGHAEIKKHGEGIGETAKQISESFKLAFEAVKLFATGFAAFEGVRFVKELAEGAGKVEDLTNGMLRLGQNQGIVREALQKTNEAIKAMGFDSEASAKNLSRLLTANISPETAQQLAGLAKKIASTYAVAQSEVFNEITRAAIFGQSRNLAQYGIRINPALAVAQEAQARGRHLFQDEYSGAYAAALLRKGENVPDSGGVEGTTEKIDNLNTAFKELKDTIGDLLLPAFRTILDDTTEFVKGLADLIKTYHDVKGAGDDFFKALDGGISLFLTIVAALINPIAGVVVGLYLFMKALEQFGFPKPPEDRGGARNERYTRRNTGGFRVSSDQDDSDAVKEALARKDLDKQQERALEELRLKEQATAAAFKIQEEGLKKELALAKESAAQREVIDKNAFAQGTISFEEFYARRREDAQKTYEAEAKLAQKQVEAASAAVGLAAKDAQNPQKLFSAQQQLAAAKAHQVEVDAKSSTQQVKLTQEEIAAREKNRVSLQSLIDKDREAADTADLQAALDTITHKYEEMRKSLDEVAKAKTYDLERTEKQRATNDKFLAVLQRTNDLTTKYLDNEQALVNLQAEQGQITTADKQNATNAIIARRVQLERDQADAIQKRLDAGGLERGQVAQLTGELLDHAKKVNDLEATYQSFGKTIRQTFTNDLGNFFTTLITRTKSLKDALKDLARSTLQNLAGVAGKNAAENVVKLIIDNTGGGEGIFGKIGKLFGDKGTEANPMVVRFSVAQAALFGGNGGGGGLFGPGGLFSGGNPFSIGGAWGPALGGGGGVVADAALSGVIPWEYALALEDGGAIVGPSHAGGGVKAELEGGEFVVKKSATAKWAGLLSAINSGLMDSVMPSRGRMFADGGMVGDSGGTSVSITINDGLASANGDTTKSARFAKSLVPLIQSQIAKEKRSGGILDPNRP